MSVVVLNENDDFVVFIWRNICCAYGAIAGGCHREGAAAKEQYGQPGKNVHPHWERPNNEYGRDYTVFRISARLHSSNTGCVVDWRYQPPPCHSMEKKTRRSGVNPLPRFRRRI